VETYTSHKFGFKIKYPVYYKAREYREEVIFRYDDFPVLLVRLIGEDSRKKTGFGMMKRRKESFQLMAKTVNISFIITVMVRFVCEHWHM